MGDLVAFPNLLDVKKCTCRAIIETPKGRRNKFDYDPESNLFRLGGLLPAGMVFPFDFGFIPNTRGGDGDPLDVMVLMDEPAHVGCLLDVRIVGVMEAEQSDGAKTIENHRLLAVAMHSYAHDHVTSIEDINQSILDQLEAFFVTYNKQRGKKFKVTKRGGPKRALAIIEAGIAALKKKNRK
jgi:inorganic pyrophosphatase